jgi:hypothetical protein
MRTVDSQEYFNRRKEDAFKKIEEAARQKDTDAVFSYIRLVRELEKRAAEELKPEPLGTRKLIE